MNRQFLYALLIGSSLIAIMPSAPAYAQTTEQTDQSEEDWRKSRKKAETPDIFEDILNTRSTGSGNGYGPPNAIDMLPEESRRHLMKQRARLIATSEPGQAVTGPYTPSEAAKTDVNLQEDEKKAWDDIIESMNGGSLGGADQDGSDQDGSDQDAGQDAAGQSPSDPAQGTGQQGQSSQGQNSQGQGSQGTAGSQGSASSERSATPLRGGSSSSASSILSMIKGLQSQGAGGQQDGQAQQGQSQDGQSQDAQGQVQSEQAQNAQSGSAKTVSTDTSYGTTNNSSSDVPDQADGSASQQSSALTQASNSSSSSAADASSQSQSDSQSDIQSDIQSADQNQAEPLGPLELIKRDRAAASSSGKASSASDYLNGSH